MEQKKDMELIFAGVKGAGVLDYVAAWYIKAANYMKECQAELVEAGASLDKSLLTRCAFVSTNSISQGEQVSVLWNELI